MASVPLSFLSRAARRRSRILCLVSDNVAVMSNQKPPQIPSNAQKMSRHGRFWARNANKKYPDGLPNVAAQRKKLMGIPVA